MKKRGFHSGLVLYGILMLIVAVLMFSCNGAGSGSDETVIPAVVGTDIADEDPLTVGIQASCLPTDDPFEIQLYLDTTVSTTETIYFRSGPLPTFFTSLDNDTGIISVDPNFDYDDPQTVEFWSESESGINTSATPLIIVFDCSAS